MMQHDYSTPIGILRAESDGTALERLDLIRNAPSCSESDSLPLFDRLGQWLEDFFSGKEPAISLPLSPKGTDFQMTVWKLLREIPYGETTSYGAIAGRIAAERGIGKMSAQAVGNAVGKNPILILIPCHRVIGSDGSLTGFGCGLDLKEFLLNVEKPE